MQDGIGRHSTSDPGMEWKKLLMKVIGYLIIMIFDNSYRFQIGF